MTYRRNKRESVYKHILLIPQRKIKQNNNNNKRKQHKTNKQDKKKLILQYFPLFKQFAEHFKPSQLKFYLCL